MSKRLQIWATLLSILAGSYLLSAQVTIPYNFTAGTTIDPDQMNSNFSALSNAALNRTGGTLTGTVNLNGQTLSGAGVFSGAVSMTAAGTGLAVTNNQTIGGTLNVTGITTLPAGAVGAPGLVVGGSATTGLYASGVAAIDFAVAGVKAFGITANGFLTSPTQPRTKVYNAAVQSIPDATETVVTYDTEIKDVGGLHSTGANTNRITIPTGGDGEWIICFSVGFVSNATGIRELWIKNQAGSILAEDTRAAVNGDSTIAQICSPLTTMAAGDWAESRVYQNSGGARNIGGDGGSYGWFQAYKVF